MHLESSRNLLELDQYPFHDLQIFFLNQSEFQLSPKDSLSIKFGPDIELNDGNPRTTAVVSPTTIINSTLARDFSVRLRSPSLSQGVVQPFSGSIIWFFAFISTSIHRVLLLLFLLPPAVVVQVHSSVCSSRPSSFQPGRDSDVVVTTALIGFPRGSLPGSTRPGSFVVFYFITDQARTRFLSLPDLPRPYRRVTPVLMGTICGALHHHRHRKPPLMIIVWS